MQQTRASCSTAMPLDDNYGNRCGGGHEAVGSGKF